MRKICVLVLIGILLTACSSVIPTPLIPTPTTGSDAAGIPTPLLPTSTTAPTTAPSATATTNPAIDNTNPLTGLPVADPNLLDRRPMAVKIENLPRGNRPQYGVTAADLVYEYYTEQGTTRFIAIYYGTDAERVGPIRSGRFFDENIIQMYKAVFAFGSAYKAVLERFQAGDYADRLVIEGGHNCPPMCRLDPNGRNILYTNTQELTKYFSEKLGSNGHQELAGMAFEETPPQGGEAAPQVYVRFSSAIYNRWDYDPTTGRYLRWVDQKDAGDVNSEVYVQLTDKQNKEQVASDNVVMLFVEHEYVVKTPEIEVFQMDLVGTGQAYAVRDGKIYPVRWERSAPDQVLTLVNEDGSPFPFKPGVTWFEVLSTGSEYEQDGDALRFHFIRP